MVYFDIADKGDRFEVQTLPVLSLEDVVYMAEHVRNYFTYRYNSSAVKSDILSKAKVKGLFIKYLWAYVEG